MPAAEPSLTHLTNSNNADEGWVAKSGSRLIRRGWLSRGMGGYVVAHPLATAAI